MTDILNQANYEDFLNLKIDIDEAYNSFIKVIDNIRSKNNISGSIAYLNHLDLDTYQTINYKIKPELTPQESRCHAFFRWVGFPVVAENKDYYNPGHDIIKSSKKKITDQIKLNTANSVGESFRLISLYRENYVANFLKIFATGDTINAGTIALMSGANIRKFSDHFSNIDPFNFEIKTQQYKIPLESQVGVNNNISLLSYASSSGQIPYGAGLKILKDNKSHLIKPFMVDPRIDFAVSPSYNRIAVPFVPDNTYLKVSEGNSAVRPILEKVIRERWSSNNETQTMGTNQKFINDLIKKNDIIKNEALIQKVQENTGDLSLTDKMQFAYFLSVIRTMIAKLVESQNIIKKAQGLYYWLPITTKAGPEEKCTSHNTFVSVPFIKNHKELITVLDNKVTQAYIQTTANSFTKQANEEAKGKVEVLNFGISSPFTTSFGTDTSSSMGDLAKKHFDELLSDREKLLDNAAQALRTVEIIMGEFSGLGLCDIIAVMGALYVMPKEDLLGFLDDDAFNRMNDILKLNKKRTANNIVKSYESFTRNVSDFYHLMDKLYEDQIKDVKS